MSEPFLGEIRMVGFNFAPMGWALCNGQLLAISQNAALFDLLGTQFGGNGTTTFGLPNMQSRVPVHQGQGAGLSPYVMGEQIGSETVALTSTQMPGHSHLISCYTGGGNQAGPSGNLPAVESTGTSLDYTNAAANGTMNGAMVGITGSGQAHANIQPVLCVNFIIALTGIFPARS
ncbi:MAG TPA: tail fiber protein [Candidatus Acidoferrum sp.]|nr:tail fiber protein [Candidatus Acidoferrum sp.]